LVLVAALLFALSLGACRGDVEAPPELLVPIVAQIRDDSAVVTRGSVAQIRRLSGITRVDLVPLNFGAAAAHFCEFYVRLGDVVYEGQLLARLDFTGTEERIARQEERIATIISRNALDNRIRALDIDIRSYGNDHTATRDIENARLELTFAREQQALALRHEEDYLADLQQSLLLSNLYAPVSGTITYIADVRTGSWISPFFELLHIAPMDAPVFIEYIGGTNLRRFGVRTVAHIGNTEYDIERRTLSRDEAQRFDRQPIRFSFDRPVEYPIGTFVSIYIYDEWEEDTLRIPRNALFFSSDVGFYAYRFKDSELVRAYLAIGPQTETYVAIVSGLEEGELVYVRR